VHPRRDAGSSLKCYRTVARAEIERAKTPRRRLRHSARHVMDQPGAKR
jgi:hypothetical protein